MCLYNLRYLSLWTPRTLALTIERKNFSAVNRLTWGNKENEIDVQFSRRERSILRCSIVTNIKALMSPYNGFNGPLELFAQSKNLDFVTQQITRCFLSLILFISQMSSLDILCDWQIRVVDTDPVWCRPVITRPISDWLPPRRWAESRGWLTARLRPRDRRIRSWFTPEVQTSSVRRFRPIGERTSPCLRYRRHVKMKNWLYHLVTGTFAQRYMSKCTHVPCRPTCNLCSVNYHYSQRHIASFNNIVNHIVVIH